MQQNVKKTRIAARLSTVLTFVLLASFAQAATFSGEAVGLQARVVGVSLKAADTGALPSSGCSLSTSVASVDVAGIASAGALSSSTSGSGSSSQSQSTLADLNLLNGLVTATAVKSNPAPVAAVDRPAPAGMPSWWD